MAKRFPSSAQPALISLLLGACSPEAPPSEAAPPAADLRPTGQFAGIVEGTDALIGIVSGEDRLLVYACDDGSLSYWFAADGSASEVALYANGGALLDATIRDDEASGTLTLPDGSAHEFRAGRSEEPVLHRALGDVAGDRMLAGWVTFDGETRGALELRPSAISTRVVTSAPPLPTTLSTIKPTNVSIKVPGSGLTPVDEGKDLSVTLPVVTISDDPRAPTPNRYPRFVVAGVGDSYGSGEGGPVDQTDDELNEPDNLHEMWGEEHGMAGCHRSDDAAVPRAFRRLQDEYPGIEMDLIFVACGGSRIEHLTEVRGDAVPDALQVCSPDLDALLDGEPVAQLPPGGEQTDRFVHIEEPPQLDQVLERIQALDEGEGKPPVDLLAMSVGGNDAGFAPAVAECITGGLGRSLVLNLGIDPDDVDLSILNALGPPCDSADSPIRTALDANGPPSTNKFRNVISGWDELARRYRDVMNELVNRSSDPELSNDFAIGQVLINQYGAGLRGSDDPDDFCGAGDPRLRGDAFGLIDPDEARFLQENLLDKLNAAVAVAAAEANDLSGGPSWRVVSAHVEAFQAHGPCADEPWTHTNNSALSRQGNNLPDLPEDCTRAQLFVMGEAISAGAGAAFVCSAGPIACIGAGGTGAVIGAIVGIPSSMENSAVSAGLAHPNRTGWAAIADAMYPEFERSLRLAFTPARPDRLRQVAARRNGEIVMRWDDLAQTETRYEIAIVDHAFEPVREARVGAGVTEYTFEPGRGFAGFFRVRACNDEFCSPYTAEVKATNIKASVPTDVSAEVRRTRGLRFVGSAIDLDSTHLTVFGADPNLADTATKVELKRVRDAMDNAIANPIASVFDSPFPFPTTFVIGGAQGLQDGTYEVRAASCNVLGCSGFSEVVTSVRREGGGAPMDVIKDELPPGLLDRFGRILPVDRTPPGGPDPSPEGNDPDPMP